MYSPGSADGDSGARVLEESERGLSGTSSGNGDEDRR